MRYFKFNLLGFALLLSFSCKQNISLKHSEFTSINPLSLTSVVFSSERDTVLVSTYNGKIYEIIKGRSDRKLIASIDDEFYDVAYNPNKGQIYAATLNSGVLVISSRDGRILRSLPVDETWAYQICHNKNLGIIGTYDFKGNCYLWDSNQEFKKIDISPKVKNMQPKYISDNGDIYFDGQGKVSIWNFESGSVKENNINGKLTDVDINNNFLFLGSKEFAYYHFNSDSIRYKNKHPNWPIYVPEHDTIVDIPLNLEIISGLLTSNNVYTIGLDKSIRKWDKTTGKLIETYVKHTGTPSGMVINDEQSQMVTIDLSGRIEFWDL